MQRRWPLFILAALALLLSGCAVPTIRSEVTAFNEWPSQLPDKSFIFERSPAQEKDLEYRNYEGLVRTELLRLGFTDAASATQAALKVSMHYQVNERDVRIVEPVVLNSGWGPNWPYRYYDPFGRDPFWYSPPIIAYQEYNSRLYRRELQLSITRLADSRKLYDAKASSEGRTPALATIMPYMVQSIFADFPGKSGVTREVELEFKNNKRAKQTLAPPPP